MGLLKKEIIGTQAGRDGADPEDVKYRAMLIGK